MSIDFRAIGGIPKTTAPKRSSAGHTVKSLESSLSLQSESAAVHFSDAGAILRNAERLVASLPIVDSAKISAITESLDNGSYVVDADRVAEKIIEFEQKLAD
ncbi:MAG: flagellar biosynthesis anti-sigma factor FlgM [Gammaproteobacteria bacterium]